MSDSSSKANYRTEIDGLRAVAVIAVILYHLELPLFEGGFVGVDIFFVISGFLITRLILAEIMLTGAFNFLSFYERRARRILPMLIVVIIVSSIYGFQALLPSEAVELFKSSLTALYFHSNLFFFQVTTEYGAESSLLKPMLHTWSLGIEEQFYILFPVLCILFFRFFTKYLLVIFIFLFLISLLSSQVILSIDSSLNFFFPVTRFWELLAGSIIAYFEIKTSRLSSTLVTKLLPKLGLFLIAFSIFYFDYETPHPSFLTLIPVIGTALIIAFKTENEFVGKLLSNKLFTYLGITSFSAYLWHYPIFAFARHASNSMPVEMKIVLVLSTFILAALSYKIVEQPFRHKISSVNFWAISATSIIALTVSLTYFSNLNNLERLWYQHVDQKRAQSYLLIRDTQIEKTSIQKDCVFNAWEADRNEIIIRIRECRKLYGPAIFILGDSHAENIFNAYGYSNKFPFVVGTTQGGCRPHGCLKNIQNHYIFFLEEIFPLMKETDTLLFHQSGSYLIQDKLGRNDSQTTFIDGIYKIDFENISKIEEFLNTLTKLTNSRIIWLGPFPEYRFNPKTIAKELSLGNPIDLYMSMNPISVYIFQDLENVLKNRDKQYFDYHSFNTFYETRLEAIVDGGNGQPCFQFRDTDHFSQCGEKRMGKLANFVR